ncbi:MAG TPA: HEAT repeat domain-containing protein [Coriobacteriia bacterium]
MTVYAIGSTNDDLVRKLRGPDPRERAGAAEQLGYLHDYLALPHLLSAARSDAVDAVREAARLAVRALMPSQEAADRAIAGESPLGSGVRPAGETRANAAAAVIDAFRGYVEARHTDGGSRSASANLADAVVGYLGTWGGESADALDGAGLAAAHAIGAIARHVEIPPQQAGCKWTSYRDAQVRVAAYDAAVGRTSEGSSIPESDARVPESGIVSPALPEE